MKPSDGGPSQPDITLPAGFVAHVGKAGIKDEAPSEVHFTSADVLLLKATSGAAQVAGVFTQSLFAGPNIALSQANIADGTAQAVVVVSKNANVATGSQGTANCVELAELAAKACGCDPSDVIVGATGVIGVQLPMKRVRGYFAQLGDDLKASSPEAATTGSLATTTSALDAATAIMTTDTYPKASEAAIANSSARVVGIAKGAGMIEPDMATMISVITTDATLPTDPTADPASTTAAARPLNEILRRVADRTFNALSIDTDTSTSDFAVILASGQAGPVSAADFEAALEAVCLDLTRQLAADGEGAQTLIVVTVDQAKDTAQAKKVAKAIVNSPLVKTAVHGADPNWGRVAMAIGKCQDETDIDPNKVVIRFGTQEVYPTPATPKALTQLSEYLAGEEVLIHVSLGPTPTDHTNTAASTDQDHSFTAYGCDLTDGYIRINADYTT